MKKLMSTLGVLVSVFLAQGSATANAGSRLLKCELEFSQGTAQIEVISAEGHPELKVLKVALVSKVSKGVVHLVGVLGAQVDARGNLTASGLVLNQPGSETIINPELVVLQGRFENDGTLFLSLNDQDRMLQRGYGIGLRCR